MTDLRSLAHTLGGEVSGRSVLCPGPGHSARDRSLSVLFSSSAPDGFLCRSYSGDDWSTAKDYVRQRLGLEFSRRHENEFPGAGKFQTSRRQDVLSAGIKKAAPLNFRDETVRRRTDHDADRTARALAIWNEARHPVESPVERYLARRGLDLPDDPREVVRFHPSCPFAGTRTRAMVALVRDIVTNEPKAIHRTALDLAGNKIVVNGKDRLAFGPIGGGAIKITADENVITCLGVAEGLETALSLQLLSEFGRSPMWSLISAGGIAAFPVLSGIECLWVAVDNDPAGLAAAYTIAQRWRCAGREVFLVKAIAAHTDLNDLVEVRHG